MTAIELDSPTAATPAARRIDRRLTAVTVLAAAAVVLAALVALTAARRPAPETPAAAPAVATYAVEMDGHGGISGRAQWTDEHGLVHPLAPMGRPLTLPATSVVVVVTVGAQTAATCRIVVDGRVVDVQRSEVPGTTALCMWAPGVR